MSAKTQRVSPAVLQPLKEALTLAFWYKPDLRAFLTTVLGNRERNHGERFTKLMDGFMADWRTRRDQLNAAPLGHEDWSTGERS